MQENSTKSDDLVLYERKYQSRFLLGTALFPSPEIMQQSIGAAQTQLITTSLRRQAPNQQGGESFWQLLKATNCDFLPNTAGCRSAKEAIELAKMARELFATNWIKLEVIGDEYTLQPDPFELVIAAKNLIDEGFAVLPYCTDDLVLCQKLLDVGCQVLMPWGAPIGTGRGLHNPYALQTLRERIPDIPLIIDAGIGAPSHAAFAMELGFDAVLLNTAVAEADNPVQMANAFKQAIEAGRQAFLAGTISARQTAKPSTPTLGMPFWHQDWL